jgi:hypothetical protein
MRVLKVSTNRLKKNGGLKNAARISYSLNAFQGDYVEQATVVNRFNRFRRRISVAVLGLRAASATALHFAFDCAQRGSVRCAVDSASAERNACRLHYGRANLPGWFRGGAGSAGLRVRAVPEHEAEPRAGRLRFRFRNEFLLRRRFVSKHARDLR